MESVGFPERILSNDVIRRAFAANSAVEGDDPGRMPMHHRKVVRHDDDGEPVHPVNVGDDFVERSFSRGVDAFGGFVEEEQSRLAEQAESDEDTLELSARERRDRFVEQSPNAEIGGNGWECEVQFFAASPKPIPREGPSKCEEFTHREGQTGIEGEPLRDVPDGRQRLSEIGTAQETVGAGSDRDEAEPCPEESGLAGTIWTNERDQLAVGNLEADILQDATAAQVDAEMLS